MTTKKKSFSLLLVLLVATVLRPSESSAQLVIEITEGMFDAMPIAVVPFGSAGQRLPIDVASVIESDLKGSGRFAPMSRTQMLDRPTSGAEMDFADWRMLAVDAVVVGRVTQVDEKNASVKNRDLKDGSNNLYRITFQAFDVLKGEQLLAYTFTASPAQLRGTAHRISDLVYETLTGEKGVFATRVAYINKVGSEYRLVVADSDGENPQILVRSPEPLMSPTWSNDGRQVAYVAFNNIGSAIYVQDVNSGRRRKVSSQAGVNGAPAFSPRGDKLALTLSNTEGNLDIYVVNLSSGSRTQVTRHSAIDTEPVWLEDNRTLLFTSDRGGNPQIYRARVGSRDQPKRVTFEGKYNARARVSPDQNHIAVVHGANGRYNIGLVDLRDGSLLVLTDGQLDESPSFAPNGAMLLYATQKSGRAVLAAVSRDGRFHQQLTSSSGDIREPAWSPYIE